VDREQRQHGVVVHALKTIADNSKQAVVSANPELAIAVLVDCAHEVVCQSISDRKRTKLAVAIADQASALAPNPECAVAGDGQTENIVVGKGGCVFAIVLNETRAIETKQAAGGADPQIAIVGLREGLNDLFWKAILHTPDSLGVCGSKGRLDASDCNWRVNQAK